MQDNISDDDKVAEWLAKNQPKVIPINQGGENVVKHFFVRKKKGVKKFDDVIPHPLDLPTIDDIEDDR